MSLDVGSITQEDVDGQKRFVGDKIVEIHQHMNNILDSLTHNRLVTLNFIICLNAKQIEISHFLISDKEDTR